MSQKAMPASRQGFANIIVIGIVVLFIGVVGIFALTRKPAAPSASEQTRTVNNQIGPGVGQYTDTSSASTTKPVSAGKSTSGGTSSGGGSLPATSTSTTVSGGTYTMLPGVHYVGINFSSSTVSASGSVPLDVTFGSSLFQLDSTYTVDFGDGQSGAIIPGGCIGPAGSMAPCRSAYIDHKYTSAGTYTAKLYATVNGIIVSTATITVLGQ